ncbi:MAG: thymidine phosphorylase [Candidatus Cloacimonetes bacterium]|nr:thymidine phosphorylase [Candidatus Cloacimonadota bacterium]MCB5255773.1 thymidine phosphorylase [Candidatus Cloacimonadota bacterium]MCK9178435.1 thymidine phosphorylase [Candidatus Cloacimonadota bacterium]MCK9242697.1 thymidine phosphorylase [Candidatus Cloacimonadota bacterium]MDD3104271.1 thymidine phosphorylase [Candidatus Cloacimonadota bacterium]
MQYNPVELILKKRNGFELTEPEISYFITNYLAGSIPEYQMSALLMCFFFQGAMPPEISALTKCYIESGKQIDFGSELKVADKHSTGGVGDKISLMLAPIAAALGMHVPMISGRGLGHTGGTLDKLEAIPGFNTQYSIEDIKKLVLKHGYALVGQSEELVPADKHIYALRDVTGTVESPALITASIMSKKIAEGARYLVIDLKIGSGAFMPNLRRAKELAGHLIHTGKSFGQKVSVVFSNMNSPLGQAVGNALETIEAIEYLKGNYLPDTYEITTALITQMLKMSGLAGSRPEAEKMINSVVEDGSALAKFAEIIAAQKGDAKVIEDYSLFDTAKYQIPILAKTSGYVHAIDARAIGYALVQIKAGRMQTGDKLDFSSGALLNPKISDKVEAGEQIGTVHANSEDKGRVVAELIRDAYKIAPVQKEKEPLIYEIME